VIEDEVPQQWATVALLKAIGRNREAAIESIPGIDALADASDATLKEIRRLEDDAIVALSGIANAIWDSMTGWTMARKIIDQAGAGWLREVLLERSVETLPDEKRRMVEAEGEASS
jgi:hypothetical protein